MTGMQCDSQRRKGWMRTVPFKTFARSPDDDSVIYDAVEEDLKEEPAKTRERHTRLGELFDNTRVQLVYLRK